MADKPQVTGQRSPRWAFMAKLTIPCENGLIYLFRIRIIQTPWFGIYLHDIYEPDSDREPHNHPWAFVSIVLRGCYREILYPDPTDPFGPQEIKFYKRFSAHRMGRDSAHRITYAGKGLKTLILTGPRKDNWGFFDASGKFIPWWDYEGGP